MFVGLIVVGVRKEPTYCAPKFCAAVSEIAEQLLPFRNPHKMLHIFVCGHKRPGPSSGLLLVLEAGGCDHPWLVCRGQRELQSPSSCFSLNALLRLGGPKTLSEIFHRSAVSSAALSLLCGEKLAEVWVEEGKLREI